MRPADSVAWLEAFSCKQEGERLRWDPPFLANAVPFGVNSSDVSSQSNISNRGHPLCFHSGLGP